MLSSSSLCNWCHNPTSYCAFSSKHLLLLDTIYTLLQSICHTATRSGLIPLTLNRCSRIYSVIIVIHSSTCCCCRCSSCLPDTTLHYLLENKTTVALDGHTPYHPPPPPVIFSPSLEPKASSLDFPEPTTILNK